MRGKKRLLFVVILLTGCRTYPLTAEGRAGCDTSATAVSDGDPTMLPGSACTTCHSAFTAAGTVFSTPSSGCSAGASGVRVEILDSTGRTAITMITNSAGNFYTQERLPSPYRARVTATDGTSQTMSVAQTSGSCAHCHRLPPANAATGRIATMVPTTIPDAGVGDAR